MYGQHQCKSWHIEIFELWSLKDIIIKCHRSKNSWSSGLGHPKEQFYILISHRSWSALVWVMACCQLAWSHILQPPNYLIIIVNRITYSNNRITKNKSRMPLDLYIKLGPYKFSLQASVDHHGYSMNSGHYTASINCCGKTFHCYDNKITECNITDTYNSSTAYILLYKLMLC